MRALALVGLLVLAGCISLPGSTPPPVIAATPGESPAVTAPPKNACVAYTKAQSDALSDALQKLDAANFPGRQAIEGFLTDYHSSRVALHCPGAE